MAAKRTRDVLIDEDLKFDSLLLKKSVLDGLRRIRFKRPSPVQLKAIPYGKCGLDMVVQAKSGTGKTCVFAVVALEMVSTVSSEVQVIVLAPTREIAVQVHDVILTIGACTKGLKCHVFIGGMPLEEDKKRLAKCHIAIGTPGRIKNLIELNLLKADSVRLFVLDEADKLLEAGSFQEQINWIYSTLPKNKQVLALSATYPEYLAEHLKNYMNEPIHVRLDTKELTLLGIKQYYVTVLSHHLPHVVFERKAKKLVKLLRKVRFQQCMVFSNYQTRAEHLADMFRSQGWPAEFIAGKQSQEVRLSAMEKLKRFQCRILISTDLTSRGIDCDKVDLVINLDLPWDTETYLHRIGRAGRFGNYGMTVSFVAKGSEEKKLKGISQEIKYKIEELPEHLDFTAISDMSENASATNSDLNDPCNLHDKNRDTTEDTSDLASRHDIRLPLDTEVKYPSSATAYHEVGEKLQDYLKDATKDLSDSSKDLLDALDATKDLPDSSKGLSDSSKGLSDSSTDLSDSSRDLSGERDDFSNDLGVCSHAKNELFSNDCQSKSVYVEAKIGFFDQKERHKNAVKPSEIDTNTVLSNFEVGFRGEEVTSLDESANESISNTVNFGETLRGDSVRTNVNDNVDTVPTGPNSELEVSSFDTQDSRARSVSNDSDMPRRMCEFFMSRTTAKKPILDSNEIPSLGEHDAKTSSANCEVLEMTGDTLIHQGTIICETSQIHEECDNSNENIETTVSSSEDARSQGLFSSLRDFQVPMDDFISDQLIESCVADLGKCDSGHLQTNCEARASKDNLAESNFSEGDEKTQYIKEISSIDIAQISGCFVSEDLIEVVAQDLDIYYSLLGIGNEIPLKGDSEENQSELVIVQETIADAFIESKACNKDSGSLIREEGCRGRSFLEISEERIVRNEVPAEFSVENETSLTHLQRMIEKGREIGEFAEKSYEDITKAAVIRSSKRESPSDQFGTEVEKEGGKDKIFETNSLGRSITNDFVADVEKKISLGRNEFKGDLDIQLGDDRKGAQLSGRGPPKRAENRDFQQDCKSRNFEENSERGSKTRDRNDINGAYHLDNKKPIGYREGGRFKINDHHSSREVRKKQDLRKGTFARKEGIFDKHEAVRMRPNLRERNELKSKTYHKVTNLNFQEVEDKQSRYPKQFDRSFSDPTQTDGYKSFSERQSSHPNSPCTFKEPSYEGRYCKFLKILDNAYCSQVTWLRCHEAEFQRRKNEHAYRSCYRSYYWY